MRQMIKSNDWKKSVNSIKVSQLHVYKCFYLVVVEIANLTRLCEKSKNPSGMNNESIGKLSIQKQAKFETIIGPIIIIWVQMFI